MTERSWSAIALAMLGAVTLATVALHAQAATPAAALAAAPVSYTLIGSRPFCSPVPSNCPQGASLWAGSCKYGGDSITDVLSGAIQQTCASACACDEWGWSCIGSSFQPLAGYHAACTAPLYAGSFKTGWMNSFSSFLNGVPLNQIPLAGAHDAATYSIPAADATIPASFISAPVTIIATFFPPPFNIVVLGALSSIQVPVLYNAQVSPDQAPLDEARQILTYVNLTGTQATPALYGVTSNWARAQDVNVLQQLDDGIRYLDLRVGVPGGATSLSQVQIVHGLFGTTLTDVLNQVQQFYAQPAAAGEVVILDFQNMSNLNDAADETGTFAVPVANRQAIQQAIVDQLWQLFGARLAVPGPTIAPNATFGAFRAAGYNVIVLYRNDTLTAFNLNSYAQSKGYTPFLWNRDATIVNPYVPTNDTVAKLLPWLKANYSTLDTPTKFTVLQGINATTGAEIARGFVPLTNTIDYPTSLQQAADSFTPVIADIVLNNSAQVPPPAGGHYNIVIGDWYERYPFTDNLIAAAQQLGAGQPFNPYNSSCFAPNETHLGCMPSGFDFAAACNWAYPGSHVVYTPANPAQNSWSCSPGGGFSGSKSLAGYCQSIGFGTSRPTNSQNNFDAFGWYCCYNNTSDPAACQPVQRNPQPCDATTASWCGCMYPSATCQDTSAITSSCAYNCPQVATDWVAAGHPASTGNPFLDQAQCQIFHSNLQGSCSQMYTCLWGQYACQPEFVQLSGTFQLLAQYQGAWYGVSCLPASGGLPALAILGPQASAANFTATTASSGFTLSCNGSYLTAQNFVQGATQGVVLSTDSAQALIFQPQAARDGFSMWMMAADTTNLLTGTVQGNALALGPYTSATSALQLWRLPDSPPTSSP